ncbi:hypothetical protein H0H81_008582 [Sphagnurus paluster]|uniref:Uncharacterized protein n=1 Tax=Sphagnurus paluster TaxID=117069 RepID=A0A9P7KMP4_9AGAR|nr:hypothetical protein H0H81_008582 [Sphagnurus paluster]
MGTDPTSHRLSRASSTMGRPTLSPMGPRSRFQRSSSNPSLTLRNSLVSIAEPSPPYPATPENQELSLPSIEEDSPPRPASSASSSFTSIPTTPKVVLKPATLVPAPTLNFESVPIPWKALPHEAALWTFDSHELQELVSRAIRRSAPETYIRLLSLQNLETVLPAEIDRLTSLKAAKQAQYRFLVHRRTMTLQALNSSFIAPEKADSEDGMSVTSKLALQLSQTAAECDKILEELLMITDQLAQISSMVELHWSSALAVALRKLNKSYAKRTSDVVASRKKIKELEEQLEDAWKEAERIAKELDEIDRGAPESDGEDVEEDEEEEAVIETAAKVDVSRSRHASAELLVPSRRNTGHMEALPMFTTLSPMPPISDNNTATTTENQPEAEAGPSTPAPTPSPSTPPENDKAETVSILSTRSYKSTKSARSAKSGRSLRGPDGTRASLVAAARTRSHRTSKGSLRLPKSNQLLMPPYPPVPDLPLEFASAPIPYVSSRASSQIFSPDVDDTDSRSRITSGRSRHTSLDDCGFRPGRLSMSSVAPTVTMDDIYVRLQSRFSDDIQVVHRTPPPGAKAFPMQPPYPAQIQNYKLSPQRHQPHPSTSKAIPSMWLMAETTPAPQSARERVASIKRTRMSAPGQTYKKLKILTKRYSMPFTLFKTRTESEGKASSKSPPVAAGCFPS